MAQKGNKSKLFVRIIALILAALMVLGVAFTLIYVLLNS